MPTVQQDVAAIRTAVYGRDVREAIADGIEHCYNDAEGGIQRANTAANNADTAAQNADAAAQNVNAAIQNATTAAGAANSAANAANVAAQNANTAAQDTTEAVQNGIRRFQEELDKKAKTDGYYQDLTAGNAEQLISTQFVEDKALYMMRKAGGSADVEDREYLDKIVGGTVAWNQKVNDIVATKSVSGITFTNNNDGSITLNGTASANVGSRTNSEPISAQFYMPRDNHVILISITNTMPSGSYWGVQGYGISWVTDVIQKYDSSGDWRNSIGVYIAEGTTLTNVRLTPQCIDLTRMFGTTIADYIYSLEQANAGDGVVFFRKLFPASYYPYNAGELVSVNALSHDTVGFNQWDEEWETGFINGTTGANVVNANRVRSKNFCPCLGGMEYCRRVTAGRGINIFWYDIDKRYISYDSGGITTGHVTSVSPENARYFKIGTTDTYGGTYNHDICINLSDPARNGEYEPYEKRTYPMADIDLRGIVKLDEEGELYYDGDEYTPDGTVTRKYGIVDLGTLGWVTDQYGFRTSVSRKTHLKNNSVPTTIIGANYTFNYNLGDDKTYSESSNASNTNVWIKDSSYSDAASFKAAMSGVYLVYELKNPTTETADPFANVQVIDGSGTEAFTTGTVLPPQAEARFPANLRDKLQHLPSLADSDGQYLIKQTGSGMKLIPDHKAEADGYYPDMTVGNSEQLVSTVGVEDDAPYVFRTAGGSADIGDREEDMLVGGTVCWNQLADNWQAYDATRSTVTKNGHTITQVITAGKSATNAFLYSIKTQAPNIIPLNHKVLMAADITTTLATTVGVELNGSRYYTVNLSANMKTKIGTVSNVAGVANAMLLFYPISAVNNVVSPDITIVYDNIQFIDLTQMFGTTIADYIYSLEQAHAGDGVAFFRKLFPKLYYEHNPGELISVNASAHKTTGFNQWDEEWEVGSISGTTGEKISGSEYIRSKNFIPVLPNTQYFCSCGYINGMSGRTIALYCYDANFAYIGRPTPSGVNNGTFTTLDNCYYLMFRTGGNEYASTYQNDICINLSWDGERDGEYEPYTENVYPLGDVELRGIAKLDANNKLVFDGDTYESDGTVTRKYGIVDLGTLTYTTTNSYLFSTISLDAIIKRGHQTNTLSHFIFSDIYTEVDSTGITGPNGTNPSPNMTMALNANGRLYFNNTLYNSIADFKTAMSGVMLVYELATPTTEESDPFVAQQKVDDFGTEEYIDRVVEAGDRDVSMPVGHHTMYQANLRAKLEMAPNSPEDGDGDYVVRQTSGTNNYVKLETAMAEPLSRKADTDGNYEGMTVGNAEQIVSTVGIEDQVPYTFRTAGGSADIGDRENDKIIGGTVAWNQHATSVSTTNYKIPARITLSESGGTYTFTFNSDGNALVYDVRRISKVIIPSGHIVFARIINANTTNLSMSYKLGYSLSNREGVGTSFEVNTSRDTYLTTVVKDCSGISIYFPNAVSGDSFSFDGFQLFDLTQMFGSTIAEYLRSLQEANVGDGVAWLKKFSPRMFDQYNAYNPGELLSVSGLQSHDMTGFNQFDKSKAVANKRINANGIDASVSGYSRSDYIPIIPNTQYYTNASSGSDGYSTIAVYDTQKNFIGCQAKYVPGTFITPNNAGYVILSTKVSATPVDEMVLNLHWDGERNGEYEPYTLHSYPLDDSLTLRGIPRLDSNNKLYYDGDIYEPDGTVTRQYGIVDLGTLTWNKYNSNKSYFRNNNDPLQLPRGTTYVICSKYVHAGGTGTSSTSLLDKALYVDWNVDGRLIISDSSYSDAATFKAAMSGVYLVYKLSEPTTETAEPFSDPQIVNDWGTEEYVTDSIVPVGHVTNYQPNLRAKLEMSPDSPEGDGDYIVRQSNGENTYVPLVIPNELPAMPTSNGTYVLKATVSNGTPILSWVAG